MHVEAYAAERAKGVSSVEASRGDDVLARNRMRSASLELKLAEVVGGAGGSIVEAR